MFSKNGVGVVVFLIVVLAALPMTALGQRSRAVSPGAPDRIPLTRDECPGFSWVEVFEAENYELIVYRLAEGPEPYTTAGIDLDLATEVLFTQVPGGATSWTPALHRCLVPGGSYAWFVRAVFDTDTGEASEWSEPLLFSVAAGPSALEVEHALSVLERYLEHGGGGAETDTITPLRVVESRFGSDRSPASDAKAGPRPVLTGIAAIRGEQPDTTGETYGVVGTSASPNGAGIGAVNTFGGADLVLDGSAAGAADARFSESGVNRPSASAQSFAFNNTGGGGMMLEVEGVEVVTTATDHDTLANLGPLCAFGELAKWNGASWVCDGDLDTLAGLSCAGDQVAEWNGSQWVCADNGGTGYTTGLGIIIDNGEIRLDPDAFAIRVSVLDSTGNVGWGSSLAIGSDGLGLIAYEDADNTALKVAHCDDVLCADATITVIDGSGGVLPSVTIGADGLGLISYYNGDLRVAHCDDLFCSSATLSTLDDTADVGMFSSVAIGSDDLGIISYYDGTNGNLKLAHCDNVLCTSATLLTRDFIDDVGWYTSLAIGADDLALVSYYDRTYDDLKVLHCHDVLCSTASVVTIDSRGDVGRDVSLVIGADGLGLIGYRDNTSHEIKVAHCENAACTTATISTIGGGSDPSVVIGSDGVGLIALSAGGLGVAHCSNLACTSARFTALEGEANLGADYISLAIGVDGHGLASYYDQLETDDGNLNVAHLPVVF